MAVINGINENTIENMQLDAGVLLKTDIEDIERADFSNLISRHNVGATKGATTFSATPEIRNIFEGIDGVRGDIKDGNVIDKWTVTFKTTVTELTADNLKMALGCGTYDAGSGKFEKIEPNDTITTSDYQTFTWIGTMAGSENPIVIILRDCLNTNGLTITAEDKNTGTVEIELKAHIDLGGSAKKQFTVYLPKNRQVLAASETKELKLDK